MARRKTDGEFWYDEEAAQKAVDFFAECCTHSKGPLAGKPFRLDEWQERDIVRPLFGWKRPDGTRRYRKAYIEIPRKNGKSTLCAGLGLYLLLADGEASAEVYSAAADRDQAAIVFEAAKSMAQNDSEMSQMLEVYRRSMVAPATASSYKVLSADAKTKHGFNASGILFDELHAQPNRELFDVLTTSTGARVQPVEIYITTAGYDRHSICYEVHEYACKVRDGIVKDDSFLVAIYAAGDKDDWTSPETWAKANPGLGKSITLDYLERECARAKEVPAYQNTFRRLHLNQWTEQATRWIDMAVWDRNADPINEAELAGRRCFIGLDLANNQDVAAKCNLFPPEQPYEKWIAIWTFWVPREGARQRARRDRVPYEEWIRDGLMQATDGDVRGPMEYEAIRQSILADVERYDVREVAYDPWNATGIVTNLQSDGVTVVPFRQGFASMSPPTKDLLALLLSKKLSHGGNPVARWMASNVSVKQDPAGNIKPDKEKSTEKIDGIVSLIMALGRAQLTPDAGASVYETEGISFL